MIVWRMETSVTAAASAPPTMPIAHSEPKRGPLLLSRRASPFDRDDASMRSGAAPFAPAASALMIGALVIGALVMGALVIGALGMGALLIGALPMCRLNRSAAAPTWPSSSFEK